MAERRLSLARIPLAAPWHAPDAGDMRPQSQSTEPSVTWKTNRDVPALPAPGKAWYRLWPPVALGLPLVAGISLTATIGDPWDLPDWRLPAGWAVVTAFAAWNAWGIKTLAAHRTGLLPGQATNTLVTSGPYRVSRNPLYLGLVTSYVGLGLLTDSLWVLLLTPAAVAAVEWGAIRPEETYLRQRFGANFEEYARRTRRWI